MPNSPCQASINISFLFIAHYAGAVTCIGLCFSLFFLLLFCFAVSVCLVKEILCSYSTCLVWLCSADKMKSWFACSLVSFCCLLFYRKLSCLSAK